MGRQPPFPALQTPMPANHFSIYLEGFVVKLLSVCASLVEMNLCTYFKRSHQLFISPVSFYEEFWGWAHVREATTLLKEENPCIWEHGKYIIVNFKALEQLFFTALKESVIMCWKLQNGWWLMADGWAIDVFPFSKKIFVLPHISAEPRWRWLRRRSLLFLMFLCRTIKRFPLWMIPSVCAHFGNSRASFSHSVVLKGCTRLSGVLGNFVQAAMLCDH